MLNVIKILMDGKHFRCKLCNEIVLECEDDHLLQVDDETLQSTFSHESPEVLAAEGFWYPTDDFYENVPQDNRHCPGCFKGVIEA